MQRSLQIDDDERRHIRNWRAERTGWAGMLLVILAASCGVFGSGLFSRMEAAGDGIRVKYARFTRATRPGELKITLERPAGTESLWISREYLQSHEVTGILPEPVSRHWTNKQQIISFAATPGEPLNVIVRLRPAPAAFGFLDGSIGTSTGKVQFWQFVWP